MPKVKIIASPFGATAVYIYEENGSQISVASVEPDGHLLFKPVDESDSVPPTLKLGPHSTFVLHAFREALDELGVKSDSDAKIAGTLEATRAHLSDLQKLLDLK